jgi:DNA replication protein DnaC
MTVTVAEAVAGFLDHKRAIGRKYHSDYSVVFERTDILLKKLRTSRLDNSHDNELRKLIRADLLILDDFALQALDPLDTADIYELIVERHRVVSGLTA